MIHTTSKSRPHWIRRLQPLWLLVVVAAGVLLTFLSNDQGTALSLHGNTNCNGSSDSSIPFPVIVWAALLIELVGLGLVVRFGVSALRARRTGEGIGGAWVAPFLLAVAVLTVLLQVLFLLSIYDGALHNHDTCVE
jgi:hypothetical protein